MDDLEQAFRDLIADRIGRGDYDCLICFSGGKDSAYLAWRMKNVYNLRVGLVTVDNGFEEDDFLTQARQTAAQLGSDLYIYQPPPENFVEYYRFLITEPALRRVDPNPMCFLCGRYFMARTIRLAEALGAPLVFYGASPEQICPDNRPKTAREIKIFQMVSRRLLQGHYKKIQDLAAYRENENIKTMIDDAFRQSGQVELVFPFQYLAYDVEGMKATLAREIGWTAPAGEDQQSYLTSGCRLVELFGLLAAKAGFRPHEINQLEADYAAGVVSEAAYRRNMDRFQEIMAGRVTPETKRLAAKLGLEDRLL